MINKQFILENLNEKEFKQILLKIKSKIFNKNKNKIEFKNSIIKKIENGNNNIVYSIISENLKILLRINKIPNKNLKPLEKQKKLLEIINNIDFIPAPTILLNDYLEINNMKYPFMIQELLDGKSIEFNSNNHSHFQLISNLLYKIHNNIPKETLNLIEQEIKEENWIDFLIKFNKKNTEFLKKSNYFENKYLENNQKNILKIIQKYKKIIEDAELSFLHGDIFPPNFLINEEENKIIGLVDWDMSKIGDPAFEISSFDELYYKEYIKLAIKNNPEFDLINFNLRMKIYLPIILLSILCSVIKNPKNNKRFIERMKKEIPRYIEELL